jgi:hypothetical protein
VEGWVGHLLANGVLDEKRVGGDAEDDVAGARVGVEEAHVLPQHGLQVPPPQRAHLALAGVHPARNLCTREQSTGLTRPRRRKGRRNAHTEERVVVRQSSAREAPT